MSKQKILVHACCATCAGYVLEKLQPDYIPILFYYNPNIHPLSEYKRRKDELQNYAQVKDILFIEEPYDPASWQTAIQGLEAEPEKGLRCHRCFEMRLEHTASFAYEHQIPIFTTTLTISPHKSSPTILGLGTKIAKDKSILFLAEDFKKKNGFLKTMEIAKGQNFYRQNYCGCRYSVN